MEMTDTQEIEPGVMQSTITTLEPVGLGVLGRLMVETEKLLYAIERSETGRKRASLKWVATGLEVAEDGGKWKTTYVIEALVRPLEADEVVNYMAKLHAQAIQELGLDGEVKVI